LEELSRAIYIVNDLIYIFKQLLWPQCENGLQVAGMEARKLAGRTDQNMLSLDNCEASKQKYPRTTRNVGNR